MRDNYKKENYLIKKIEPFKAKEVKNIDDLLSSLKNCGFQGRNLGKALDTLEKMVFCLLYTSPSPRDGLLSRMPSSA